MKNIIKLEELGLFIFFAILYFNFYSGSWGFFLALFFVPDVSFACYLIHKKAGTIAYNCFHHKGIMAVVILVGCYLQNDLVSKTGLIFMAHSCFDRSLGYGLKYFDSFDHTHLGWIGKSKNLNP